MTEKKKRPAKAAKKPIETTWVDLPPAQREKLAAKYRRLAKGHMRDAACEARRAKKEVPGGFWEGICLRRVRAGTKDAAEYAAIADLIERNLGRSK